jgi:hypothetical protein
MNYMQDLDNHRGPFPLVPFLVLLVVLFLAWFPAPASACTSVKFTLASYHFDRKGYNELNPGVGCEERLSDSWRVAAGGYHNSKSRDSAYLLAVPVFYERNNWMAGGLIGPVSGYRDGDKLALMLGFVVAYEPKGWGAELVIFPPADGNRAVLGFGLRHTGDWLR